MGRVFLSHSSKDKDFLRELYRRLTRDGVDFFFDVESISTTILNGTSVLAGTGGLGKSQLAIEYVHRLGRAVRLRFWTHRLPINR